LSKFNRKNILFIIILICTIPIVYIYNFRTGIKATETEISNNDLTFAVFGDVHENIDSFQVAIDDLNSINPSTNALVLNGDTVDQGIGSQYDSVKEVLNKNKDILPKTIIKNIGNHEFFDYNTEVNSKQQVQTFINRYLEFSGEQNVYHDTWINKYHFISIGSEDGNSETINSVTATISEKQQNWLKEKLAEDYQKGKPIFIFLHQHLVTGNTGWVGVLQSVQVKQILSQYPEVILFTSHTHRDLDQSSVVLNQPFTMVHTGAISYTLIPDSTSENGRKKEEYVKGLYIEVNGNNVTIKGRDFKEKKWIFTKELSN
jgi:hypothetical protein